MANKVDLGIKNIENCQRRNTNIYDFFIALLDFISNLFSAKKIICICVFYVVVIQNIILLFRANSYDEMYSYKSNAEAILLTFMNRDTPLVIIIMGAFIIFLLVAVVSLIVFTRYQRKEIDRLAKIRSELMHGTFDTINVHRSSEA